MTFVFRNYARQSLSSIARHKRHSLFFLSTISYCLGICFPMVVSAQVAYSSKPTSSLNEDSSKTNGHIFNTDLTQIINHNDISSGTPALDVSGANITINLGTQSQLLNSAPSELNLYALKIRTEHTPASKSLGISPQVVVNSSGTVEGIGIETVADTFEIQATPVEVNILNGKVYSPFTAIFINQLRSSDNSSTNIYIDKAEVYSTNKQDYYPLIAVFGNQNSPSLVNLKIGPNGFVRNKYGNAFTTIGVANIENEGTIHGNIRIDSIGQVLNQGQWMLGGNQLGINESTVSEVINLGVMGLFPSVHPTSVNLNGNLLNASQLNLNNGVAGDVWTINGNFDSLEGSSIGLDVQLGDDQSAKDSLVINGNATGSSALVIRNQAGKGKPTLLGIKIIQINGLSKAVYQLAKPVQAGQYEYFLHKINKDYYLVSSWSPLPIDPDFQSHQNTNTADGHTINIAKKPLVLRPAVTGFLMAPNIYLESNLLAVGQHYHRATAQKNAKNTFQSVWAYSGYAKRDLNAEVASTQNPYLATSHLKSQQHLWFLQFGTQLWSALNPKNQDRQSLHAMLGHYQSNGEIQNPERLQALATSKTADFMTKGNAVALEYQYQNKEGAYFNWLTQIGQIRHEMADVYQGFAVQKADAFLMSLEGGQPMQWRGLSIEPQAQLVVQQVRLKPFSDALSNIDANTQQSARVRTGMKLSSPIASQANALLFTQVDLINEFYCGKALSLDGESYSSRLPKRPKLGLGLGYVYRNSNMQLLTQLGYEKSLIGRSVQGWNLNLSFQYQF